MWRAYDSVLQREVALKIIRASMEIEASAVAHARALAQVEHPNVVRVYGLPAVVDPDTGREKQAIMMELLDGENLQDRIDRGPAFDELEVKAIGTAIIDGMEAIHSEGLAHGDFHPGNVMLCHGSAKIIDMLSRDASAYLSTATLDFRKQTDRRATLDHVRLVVQRSSMAPQRCEPLNALGFSPEFGELRKAFADMWSHDNTTDSTSVRETEFVVEAKVAIVGEAPEPIARLVIEGQNHGANSVFVEGFGLRLRDGRTIALAYDASTGNPILPREIRPGQSYSVYADPEAMAEDVNLGELAFAFIRDEVNREYQSSEQSLRTALRPWMKEAHAGR